MFLPQVSEITQLLSLLEDVLVGHFSIRDWFLEAEGANCLVPEVRSAPLPANSRDHLRLVAARQGEALHGTESMPAPSTDPSQPPPHLQQWLWRSSTTAHSEALLLLFPQKVSAQIHYQLCFPYRREAIHDNQLQFPHLSSDLVTWTCTRQKFTNSEV